jgi:hypothetical protein
MSLNPESPFNLLGFSTNVLNEFYFILDIFDIFSTLEIEISTNVLPGHKSIVSF